MDKGLLQRIWARLTERRQLTMRDRATDELHWKLNISPLALWGGLTAIIVLIIAGLMLLMAYTSILNIFPNYRTHSEAMNEELTQSIMRIDSVERQMDMMLRYNEAVTQIMSGSTPTLHSTVMTDTIRYDKSRILPTRADSLLREALERTTGDYSLSNTKPLKSEAAMFGTPLNGKITRGFEAPESSFDIGIVSLHDENSVKAVENGTVIGIERMADGYVSITIQHGGGYVSVYKQLAEALVRKGQNVQSGSVIGHLHAEEATEGETLNRELGFELWRNGTAVDPEQYILFQ